MFFSEFWFHYQDTKLILQNKSTTLFPETKPKAGKILFVKFNNQQSMLFVSIIFFVSIFDLFVHLGVHRLLTNCVGLLFIAVSLWAESKYPQ